jgi:tRNA G37 N-methylase Trm5
MSASIIPFAQSEMVMAFMEGVDPKYKSVKDSLISKIFDKYPSIIVANIEGYSEQEKQQLEKKLRDASTSLLDDRSNRLNEYRRKNYTNPVINVVSGLPKDELTKWLNLLSI